jgi:multidrug efflux pump
MRYWLDPEKLSEKNLTVLDVVNAIKEQNVQVAAGQIGQPPTGKSLDFQYTMRALGRLKDVQEFGDVVVKTGDQGQVVRMREISRIELGAKNYGIVNQVDGKAAIGLAVFQLPGSNALATADAVKAKMAELEKRFPPGVNYVIRYDTTPFIRESINEVFHTLRDAIAWSCCSSCRTGARRSSRSSPCPCPSSAPSPS